MRFPLRWRPGSPARRAFTVLATLSVFVAGPLPAQQGEAFVLLLASGDTIAVERFTRTADRLTGELVMSSAGVRFSYAATLAPDATVTRLENALRPASAERTAPEKGKISHRGKALRRMIAWLIENQTQLTTEN